MTDLVCIHREADADGQIEVWENGQRRSLWFDDVILQSEIDIRNPGLLPNPANRAMLAHLMFGQRPRRVLLAGCGGGAIARWFSARDPRVIGDAVEISKPVAKVAREYFEFPAEHSGWRLHIGNVRDYVHNSPRRYDYILVDLAENRLTPNWVTAPDFLEACRNCLDDDGVLTINLITDDEPTVLRAVQHIRDTFFRRVLCLPVPAHDNLIIMGFMTEPTIAGAPRPESLHWQLEFTEFMQRLKRNNPTGSGIF